MFDALGATQPVHVSRTLWTVIAIPLTGVLWQAWIARRSFRHAKTPALARRAVDSARAAGFVFIALTASALAAHAFARSGPLAGSVWIDAVVEDATVGLIDSSILFFALDRVSFAMSAVACLAGLIAAVRLGRRPAPGRRWAAWAWLQWALASVLCSLLADNVETLAIGWSLTTVASAWILASDGGRESLAIANRGALAIGALVLGEAIVFSAVGTGAGVHLEVASSAPTDCSSGPCPSDIDGTSLPAGTLTMTRPAGAQVLVDDAAGPALRVPFARVSIDAGSHVLYIRASPDGDESPVRADVRPGDTITIWAVGPTPPFHALAAKLAPNPRNGTIAPPIASETTARDTTDGALSAVAMLVWLAGALLMYRVPVAIRSPAPLAAYAHGAAGPIVGLFFVVRIAWAWSSAPAMQPIFAGFGFVVIVLAAGRSLRRPSGASLAALANEALPALTLMGFAILPLRQAMAVVIVLAAAIAISGMLVARRSANISVMSHTETGVWVDLPASFGHFVVRMDRWVVGSWIGMAAATVRAAARVVGAIEQRLFRPLGDRLAAWAARVARSAERRVGLSLGRMVWSALGATAVAVIAHALYWGN